MKGWWLDGSQGVSGWVRFSGRGRVDKYNHPPKVHAGSGQGISAQQALIIMPLGTVMLEWVKDERERESSVQRK